MTGLSELSPRLQEAAPRSVKAAGAASKPQVGVVDGALEGDRTALEAQFPGVSFVPVEPSWVGPPGVELSVLIVPAVASQVEDAARRLAGGAVRCPVVVSLRDADVARTQQLLQAGAADVLPSPVSDATLAACLGRLLHGNARIAPTGPAGQGSQVVAFLKAGGGVGATSLACQAAIYLAEQGQEGVCLADLDLEFGIANLLFDLPQALSIGDLLASGSALDETPLANALAAHPSHAKLLAAPRQLTPLESLTPSHAAGLLKSLRRDFRLTLVDLPSVWTAWTNQILNDADRIVLVTHLTVPHVQQVKRQLQTLAAQQLDGRPLILVCNAVTAEQRASVSVKTAEKALGRTFDVVIPDDPRLMVEAANRGQPLSAIEHGSKTRKLIGELAERIAGLEKVAQPSRHWTW
jgi:pilus assembly protein CpaE